jgi:fructose-1-phosphate kinase PfkB-like protein
VKYEKCGTFFCSEPRILTGGGDNFNAGFCLALLNDLNLFQSLIMANAVSGYYVKTGISPDVHNLIKFLKKFPADSAD